MTYQEQHKLILSNPYNIETIFHQENHVHYRLMETAVNIDPWTIKIIQDNAIINDDEIYELQIIAAGKDGNVINFFDNDVLVKNNQRLISIAVNNKPSALKYMFDKGIEIKEIIISQAIEKNSYIVLMLYEYGISINKKDLVRAISKNLNLVEYLKDFMPMEQIAKLITENRTGK